MPHQTAFLATIAAALMLALVLGYAAARLRLPPLVGYLAAGVVVGPFTPGYVADTGLAGQLAEVGVILLMFGVGLHFSVRDLLAVRRIAVPGAVARIAVVTAIGALLGHAWGWPWGSALVVGLSLSVASTVVLLRMFEQRGIAQSAAGRVAIGWLIVEDLAMVLVLVLLPALAGALGASGAGTAPSTTALFVSLGVTLLKVAAFVALMLFVGTRVVPWMLGAVARTGSRELFTLSVLATALGIAFGAALLFGVSFALGAFFAGVVIAESDLSLQAAAEALPLQDAFAVLFFVSAGMVIDPRVLLTDPVAVLGAVLLATVGKSVVSLALLLLLRQPLQIALTASAGLAQIGEFSFMLAALGRSLGLLSHESQSVILAAAIVSIVLNPLALSAADRLGAWIRSRPRLAAALERTRSAPLPPVGESSLREHAVIVGFGRVGSTIGSALDDAGVPYVVIESDREWVEALRARGVEAIFGDATRPGILEHAGVARARMLIVAAPGSYQVREVIRRARAINPAIDVVVRTHTESEHDWLESQGVGLAVMGERELALGMARYALGRWHVPPERIEALVRQLRGGSLTGEPVDVHTRAVLPPPRRSTRIWMR